MSLRRRSAGLSPRRRNRRLLSVLLVLVAGVLGLAPTTAAHEVRPGYLELRALGEGRVEMIWKQPLNQGRRLRLEPAIEPPCREVERDAPEISSVRGSGSLVQRSLLHCEPSAESAAASAPAGLHPLTERTIRIDGLERTITDVLVSVVDEQGDTQRYLLKPVDPAVLLEGTKATGVPAYLVLGVEHLLFGWDHILFVLGLLFFVPSPWRLVQTITAFTIAHSITLALSTLDIVRLAQGPVEAVIALSILFLAVELLQPSHRRSALTRDRPWLFAFTFGLLHGFGFAGALAEIGLPADAVAMALFLFNLGVELGQLLVVGIVLALMAVFGRWLRRLPTHLQRLPIYLMGVLAAAWLVERVVALW